MKILVHDRHGPHADMIARALGRHKIIAPAWNQTLRELAPNVTMVPLEECLNAKYDAVIEDAPEMTCLQARVRKKLWLQHCEYNGDDVLPKAVEVADYVLVVSEHKRATMREMGLLEKVRILPFGFDVSQWPSCCGGSGVGLGTAFNSADDNPEVRAIMEAISARVPLTVIGHHNSTVRGCQLVSPVGLSSYQDQMSRIAIWVSCVGGEALGMAALEAMAMGLPVVMGNYPEAGNFAFDNWNCMISRLPPQEAVPWMIDRIQFLLDHPADRERLGAAARKTITNLFPLSAVTATLEDILS